jgi:kinesin family member C1
VTISCSELHVETVRDLLNIKNEQVQLMTNHWKWTPTVLQIRTFKDAETVLKKAYDNRSTSATKLNDQSSRSHCIFQLKIERSGKCGSLNMVDLAGSENINASGATGQCRDEANAINKQLTSLKDVISAIANHHQHVPFRNSKLTSLL